MDAPILINLSGDFANLANINCQKGSVTGDIRLFELDAFLHTLRSVDNEVKAKEDSFLARLSKILLKHTPLKNIILEINSELDPKKHSMKYIFKFHYNLDTSNLCILQENNA